MYTIRAIWKGEIIRQSTVFGETIAYNQFNEIINLNTNNSGVTIQLIGNYNELLSDYYIV